MTVFKCKMCGGTIDFQPGDTVGVCEYCGTKQTLPKIDDERKANLYDRANHFRRANDFDKAMAIYEQILDEDTTDAEAYWSLVLCRYGIEYVEDPTTHKRVPTVNRVQYTSIFADEDYKAALNHADTYQQVIYEEEAKAIDEIQKGILAISEKEEPFDIFICYKETDNNGRRTEDSVLAYDIYKELTKEGYKVFFSRVTLEDKLGTAYEPYIFAALNSSKIMIAVGTKAEFYNAVWVKNEWSRYLALIKKGAKKTLIPAYKGMDPYDLPEEFSHLQGQDMAKLGFMQDLVRGVKKILGESEVRKINDKEIAPLINKANDFLEKKDWKNAKDYYGRVIDIDPRDVNANIGVLLAEQRVTKEEELVSVAAPFDETDSYMKAVRYAEEELVNRLRGYNDEIRKRIAERKKKGIKLGIICAAATVLLVACFFLIKVIVIPAAKYAKAKSLYENEQFDEAIEIYRELGDYKDSKDQAGICRDQKNTAIAYNNALQAFEKGNYLDAKKIFLNTIEYKDSAERIDQCNKAYFESIQNEVSEYMGSENYSSAITLLEKISDYNDAADLIQKCNDAINESIRQKALDYMEKGNYSSAISLLEQISDYNDAADLIKECNDAISESVRQEALDYMKNGDYSSAIKALEKITEYKDAADLIKECEVLQEQQKQAAIDALPKVKELMSASKFEEAYEYLSQLSEDVEEVISLKKTCNRCITCSGIFSDKTYTIESKFIYQDGVIYWNPSVLSNSSPFSYLTYTGFSNPKIAYDSGTKYFQLVDSVFQAVFESYGQKTSLKIKVSGSNRAYATLVKQE